MLPFRTLDRELKQRPERGLGLDADDPLFVDGVDLDGVQHRRPESGGFGPDCRHRCGMRWFRRYGLGRPGPWTLLG